MAPLRETYFSRSDPPIDIFEQVVRAQGWRFERIKDDEMAAEVRGNWCDYSMHFSWAPEISAVHVTCAFDVRVPERDLVRVYELLALINDRMWLGHFCLWSGEGLPLYRHAMPLRGAGTLAREQVEDLLEVAVTECERFYPAFQHLVWGGKGPADAIAAAMVETVGEA